jgi:hypothetical protein
VRSKKPRLSRIRAAIRVYQVSGPDPVKARAPVPVVPALVVAAGAALPEAPAADELPPEVAAVFGFPLEGAALGTNEIGTVPSLPPSSPKASVQVTPAAVCAGVGGHGYAAASVAALPPVLSVGQVVIR